MGEELDIKVVLAMGWKPRTVSEQPFGDGTFVLYDGPGGECMQPGVSWKVSESIAAAWQVVKWMEQHDPPYLLGLAHHIQECEAWFTVSISHPEFNTRQYGRIAPAAPEAICLAFLAAMGVEWRED